MTRLARDQQKKLADDAKLVRIWKQWHADELADAIAGAHGAIIAELMAQLDRLELSSAATLLAFMQRADWSSVSYATRLIALHEINQAVARLRECNGLPPIDDPLPGQPDNVFRRVKAALFPNSPASDRPAPALSGQTSVLGCDVTAAAQTE